MLLKSYVTQETFSTFIASKFLFLVANGLNVRFILAIFKFRFNLVVYLFCKHVVKSTFEVIFDRFLVHVWIMFHGCLDALSYARQHTYKRALTYTHKHARLVGLSRLFKLEASTQGSRRLSGIFPESPAGEGFPLLATSPGSVDRAPGDHPTKQKTMKIVAFSTFLVRPQLA